MIEPKTPDEARQTWCPFARLVPGGEDGTTIPRSVATFNRISVGDHGAMLPHAAKCIANECAVWSWWEIELPGIPRRGHCGMMR